MASFTTSNVSANPVGRELSIASSFVKQYYTLLNKAPCFIHNFYSHDSTFIHGTIELANEHYTEPVVGREKIKKKMEDLKLNDCRAKIKQIDCLETLAGGLVIQVIGELSNNGKPMRRFLQTFVLAPSPDDQARQDGDQHPQQHARSSGSADRRGVHLSENNSSAHNQKFFVLNSIFRYQDDGSYNEFEDDVVGGSNSLNANTSTDGTNGGNNNNIEVHNVDALAQQQQLHQQPQQQQLQAPVSNLHMGNSNGSTLDYSQAGRRRPIVESTVKTTTITATSNIEDVERLADNLEDGLKVSKPAASAAANDGVDINRGDVASGPKVVSNGTGSVIDKKNETTEKSTENGKVAADHSTSLPSAITTSASSSGLVAVNQPVSSTITTSRPPPSNEPKTWANMVRNAHPPAAPIQANKIASTDHQQSSQSQQQQQQHQPNLNLPPPVQAQQQQPQLLQQQPLSQQLLQQQQQLQANSQNNNNGRRRHMMRKPTNKGPAAGRAIKNNNNNNNRPPRPPAPPSKPAI